MFTTLDEQRLFGSRILVGGLWLLAVVITGSAMAVGASWLGLGAAAAGLATAATVAWRASPGGGGSRLAIAVAVMGSISLLVAAFRGQPWQPDMHMAYFAALAGLMVYCDWKAILAGATTVAVHHLLLNFVLPAAVFPGGGDLGRVIVHAVILVAEAASLMWICHSFVGLSQRAALGAVAADEARTAAEAATRVAEDARRHEQAASDERRVQRQQTEFDQNALVSSLANGLQRLAEGDLTVRLTDALAEDYETLRHDFNSAMGQLEEAIAVVAANTHGIGAGADQIAQASDDLSRRTEQQAASLVETAATLDQITATVTRTAAGAKQANAVVTAAMADVERSGAVVADAVSAMSGIETSSQQISQIIGVIDEIAFQTNLLALNAGVEAARAGDAGRGFAVVASEVRALAQRSADAAKEIKTLISDSSRRVGEGVELVAETGKVLQSIVSRVAEIDALVSEITLSAQEQSVGLTQVNVAVNQMDQVVQQNAAMVEESTAASHSLKTDTSALAKLIERFKVAPSAPPARAATARVATSRAPAPGASRAPRLAAVAGGRGAAADGWEEF